MGFVLALRQAGTLNPRVLAALERLDRAVFAPAAFRALAAFGDVALPLDGGQVMTRPSVLARMIEAADLSPGGRVLEIGTGSGYQTAALAALAGEIVSIERVEGLACAAAQRLAALELPIEVLWADGARGDPRGGAFDAIIVNAAVAAPPVALLAQLTDEGRLIAPFGHGGGQRLVRVRRRGAGRFHMEDLGPVRFAPLQAGVA